METPNRTDKHQAIDIEPRAWQTFYLLLSAGLGMLFLSSLYGGDHISIALNLIFLAVIVLPLKHWIGVMVLLGLIQVNLFYLESRRAIPIFTLNDTLWVVISVSLLAALSRFRVLQELDRQSALTSMRYLVVDFVKGDQQTAEVIATNLVAFCRSMLKMLSVIIVCGIAARIVMWLVPFHGPGSGFSTIRDFRIRPSGYRAIMLGLLLFLLYLPVLVLVNEVAWRSLSKSQAGVYLRSVFLKWNHRELRMIIRKRIKVRRKKVRELHPTEPQPAPIDAPDAYKDRGQL